MADETVGKESEVRAQAWFRERIGLSLSAS